MNKNFKNHGFKTERDEILQYQGWKYNKYAFDADCDKEGEGLGPADPTDFARFVRDEEYFLDVLETRARRHEAKKAWRKPKSAKKAREKKLGKRFGQALWSQICNQEPCVLTEHNKAARRSRKKKRKRPDAVPRPKEPRRNPQASPAQEVPNPMIEGADDVVNYMSPTTPELDPMLYNFPSTVHGWDIEGDYA